jgi:cyclophilin family peptidyl-prolyl cis-trans isomerase
MDQRLSGTHAQKIKERKSRAFGKKAAVLVVAILIIATFVGVYSINRQPLGTTKIRLLTSMGIITTELFDDMPITASNFKNLTEHGIYDGTIFHRVVPGFVIQGGDSTPKGVTVPTIPDELLNKHSNVRGSVAMAKTSLPNSATSQFFINLNDTNAASLDSNYSVFGRVVGGMDVVDAISRVPIYPPNDGKPLQDVTLISAKVIS